MSSTRVEMEDGWQGWLREAEFVFFDVQLGPDVTDDAKRYCPVDKGRLVNSLDHQVLGGGQDVPELQVGSFPDEDGPVEYAAVVDRGFEGPEIVREHLRRSKKGVEHVVHEHVRHAKQPAQPYLSTALYQERY